ncbi:MAG: ATP-binding protein [Deltaproteobacteria bacterium]|nr:ATP-binding protein [Deltaproteobacteria bacterium]
MIPRIPKFPFGRKSFFLFGPRQVGKSTLVSDALSDMRHIEIDLLKSDVLLKYKTNPELLRREVNFQVKTERPLIIFIDEIQKAPELLNEIHHLIERHREQVSFVMTGSSARKLKRASVNMLAGRAWEFRLFPLTHKELGDRFLLEDILLRGSLPSVVHDDLHDAFRTLHAYTRTYLKEEVLDEALVRNISAFSRFLDLAADQSGKIVSFSTLSRDAGVSSKTVKAYYQILEDTLIALKLEPYLKSARKRLVRHPKYYLFDLGCVNALVGRTRPASIRLPSVYGVLFEHFVILEIYRLLCYSERFFRLYHWRSAHGAKVDLVVEREEGLLAIEIKSTPIVKSGDLTGLRSFIHDYPDANPVCVTHADRPYLVGEIPVIPWKTLFDPAWLDMSCG